MRGRRNESVVRQSDGAQHIGGADGTPRLMRDAAIRTYSAPYDMTFARANHHRNGATIEASNAAATEDRQHKAARRDCGDDSIKCRNMATAIDRMRM